VVEGTRPQSAPEAAPERARTFVVYSADFALDETIDPEVRWLVTILYALAAEELRATTRDGLKSLASGPFDVKCSYETIIAKTKWTRDQVAAVLAAAKPTITVTGAPRTGYRYRVDLSMRAYRSNADAPTARGVMKRQIAPPVPAHRRQQMLLDADTLSPAAGRKTENAGDTVDPTLNPAPGRKEQHDGVPLRPADGLKTRTNGEILHPAPGPNDEGLRPEGRPKTEPLRPAGGRKKPSSNERAREHQDSRDSSSSGEAPAALLEELLLLYRVRDRHATLTSLPFTACVDDLVKLVCQKRRCSRTTAHALLGQIVSDPSWRAGAFKEPIAYIRSHLDDLLRLRLATAKTETDDALFFALPVDRRHAVIVGLSDGVVNNLWLREHHVPAGAARHGRKLLADRPGIVGRLTDGHFEELEP
jgi:hypothetical protein